MKIFLLLLLLVNIYTFYLFASDKRKARQNEWRIPESRLLNWCFIGGAVGGLLGMILLRHKSRHWKFKLGIPACIAYCLCLYLLLSDVGVMKKKYFLILLLITILSGSCTTSSKINSGETGKKVGDTIPHFSVIQSKGDTVSSSALKGKVSVVAFFHTNCKDCRKELPILQDVYTSYASNDSVSFICISREEGFNTINAFWKKRKLTLPYSAQSDRTIYRLFAHSSIPRIYIADRQGVIRYLFTDKPVTTKKKLEKAIQTTMHIY